jgi:hypothetical protein
MEDTKPGSGSGSESASSTKGGGMNGSVILSSVKGGMMLSERNRVPMVSIRLTHK